MIKSFSDEATADVFYGRNTKKARRALPQELWSVMRRKLALVDAATKLEDLKAVPGNRLEALTSTQPGFQSIRVNDRFRIVFKFDGHASEVSCEDYH